MCVFTYMFVHVHVEARGRVECLLQSLSTFFSETGSLTEPRAHQFSQPRWPVKSREPLVSVASAPVDGHPAFYMSAGDLNSCPQACTVSLPAGPAPQLPP